MKKKLVKVPKKETYYFCKRVFFEIIGTEGAPVGNMLEQHGYVAYPYDREEYDEPILLLFANNKRGFNDSYNLLNIKDRPYFTKYRLGIIITDIECDETLFDEVIDISSLQDYYQTELSLDLFIEDLMK